MLFGVEATDPLTFVSVPLVLGRGCPGGELDPSQKGDEGRPDCGVAIRVGKALPLIKSVSGRPSLAARRVSR